MRTIVVTLAWIIASFAAAANAAAPMGADDARVLLGRAGFGATEAELQSFAALPRAQAVERLLSEIRTQAQTPPPAWTDRFVRPYRKEMSEAERKAFQREQIEKGVALRAWWYREMLTTPSPLTEKMTLFWHNHFTSSQQKVRSPVLLYRQNVLLRRHALGNFGELLHAIAKDPAMLVYLDNVSNRKRQPNENFAREVMELFTLGEGYYGENDVKESARAYTGWSIDRDTGDFRFYRFAHDDGAKTVLGKSGRFDGDDVLDILLAQRRTAEFIAAKLWREFISPTPPEKEIQRIAAVFRDSGYDIKAAMRAVLTHDALYARENRGSLVKSPVEFLVGTARTFAIPAPEPWPLALAGRQLGQDIFGPPNVKGWPGGEHWINSQTLLARKQIVERLFRAEEMPTGRAASMRPDDDGGRRRGAMQALMDIRFDHARWLRSFPSDESQRRAAIERLVLPMAPLTASAAPSDRLTFVRDLVLDPTFQLK